MASKRPRKKTNYEYAQQVECMECGVVILSESQSRHSRRKHNGRKVLYKFHNDAKQPKLMFGGSSSSKAKDTNFNTPAANDHDDDGEVSVCEEVTGASDHEECGGAVAVGAEQEHSVRQEPGGSVQTVQLRRLCPVFQTKGEVDGGNDDSSDTSANVTVAAAASADDDANNDNDGLGHVGNLSPGSRKYAPGNGGEDTEEECGGGGGDGEHSARQEQILQDVTDVEMMEDRDVTATSADKVQRSLSVDNEEDINKICGGGDCYGGEEDDEDLLLPSAAAAPAEYGPKQPMLNVYNPKMYGGRQRDFQQSWFKNVWLGYDVEKNLGYCYPCNKFMGTSFTFTNWKKSDKLGIHSRCETHTTAMIKWENAKSSMANNNSVLSQVSGLHASQVTENRRYLRILIEVISWLGRQNVSFRGHSEDRTALTELSSTNRGNFLEMLNLLSAHDAFLKGKLETNGARWTSPEIQNELITLIAQFTTEKIIQEINNDKSGETVIGVISDETSDITRWEQISLVISYIDSSGNKRESFLGFIQTPQTDGETIYRLITEKIKSLGLRLDCVVGLGFDGAGNMAGINKVSI